MRWRLKRQWYAALLAIPPAVITGTLLMSPPEEAAELKLSRIKDGMTKAEVMEIPGTKCYRPDGIDVGGLFFENVPGFGPSWLGLPDQGPFEPRQVEHIEYWHFDDAYFEISFNRVGSVVDAHFSRIEKPTLAQRILTWITWARQRRNELL
jgi:hypothetical protein